jgi:hypothetical protein
MSKAVKLPGMPGPPESAIDRRLVIEAAINSLHTALLPILEALPVANGSSPSIHYTAKVRGDILSIVLRGGTGE